MSAAQTMTKEAALEKKYSEVDMYKAMKGAYCQGRVDVRSKALDAGIDVYDVDGICDDRQRFEDVYSNPQVTLSAYNTTDQVTWKCASSNREVVVTVDDSGTLNIRASFERHRDIVGRFATAADLAFAWKVPNDLLPFLIALATPVTKTVPLSQVAAG